LEFAPVISVSINFFVIYHARCPGDAGSTEKIALKLQICFIININQCPAGKNIFCSARQLDMNHHGHFADIFFKAQFYAQHKEHFRTDTTKGRAVGK